MANDRLLDATDAELLEAAAANPSIRLRIAAADPRVQLMEKLYGDPDSKKDIQKHSKRLFPKASVPEIDIPELVKTELKDDLEAIKTLRAELETDKKSRRHEAFRARLMEAGADATDLDAIETFMVDNEIGPKSIKIAVRQFYEAQEIAEPKGTASLSPEFTADEKDEHMKALLQAGPGEDLDRINTPWAEKYFAEMFGAQPGRRAAR